MFTCEKPTRLFFSSLLLLFVLIYLPNTVKAEILVLDPYSFPLHTKHITSAEFVFLVSHECETHGEIFYFFYLNLMQHNLVPCWRMLALYFGNTYCFAKTQLNMCKQKLYNDTLMFFAP